MVKVISCVDAVKASVDELSLEEEYLAEDLCRRNIQYLEVISVIIGMRNISELTAFIKKCLPSISKEQIKILIDGYRTEIGGGKKIDDKLKEEVRKQILSTPKLK